MSVHSEDETLLSDTESTCASNEDENASELQSSPDQVLNDSKQPRLPGLSRLGVVIAVCAILLSNFSTAVDSGFSASTHFAVAAAFDHANVSIWPVNAFVIVSMTFQPLYGRISDYIGRRIPYLVASSLFLLGLTFSAFAPTWVILIAARAVCGLGSAGVTTMGSVVLTDIVGIQKRGYYQSINYSVYGAGSAFGAASGGLLVQHLGWSWIYKVQLPVVITAFVLIYIGVPSGVTGDRTESDGKFQFSDLMKRFETFDWRGSLCLMVTLSSLFVFLTLGGNVLNWQHPITVVAGVGSLIAMATFLYIERMAEKPVLPPYILVQFPIGNIMFVGFLSSMINYMILYNTPIFFQTVRLDSVQTASLRLVVPSVTFTLTSALSGSFIAKMKTTKFTLIGGKSLIFAGTICLVVMAVAFIPVGAPSWAYDIVLAIPIMGVGMLAPSTVLTLLNMASSQDHAVANGGLIMMRSLGVFMGTTLSTTVVQNVLRASLRASAPAEMEQKVFDAAIKDADMMTSLNPPQLEKLSKAFDTAFIAVFCICTTAALIIIIAMWRVKVEALEDKEHPSHYEKVDDEENCQPIDRHNDDSDEDIELDSLTRASMEEIWHGESAELEKAS